MIPPKEEFTPSSDSMIETNPPTSTEAKSRFSSLGGASNQDVISNTTRRSKGKENFPRVQDMKGTYGMHQFLKFDEFPPLLIKYLEGAAEDFISLICAKGMTKEWWGGSSERGESERTMHV
jgi:hypothetical protein